MSTANYTVTGMTCHSCVANVTDAVVDLQGVQKVEVDLDSGRVTVTGAAAQDSAAVRGAVEAAGYHLAPSA